MIALVHISMLSLTKKKRMQYFVQIFLYVFFCWLKKDFGMCFDNLISYLLMLIVKTGLNL
jgi:hypothetical protein